MDRVNITLPPMLRLFAKESNLGLSEFVQQQLTEKMHRNKQFYNITTLITYLLPYIDQNREALFSTLSPVVSDAISYLNAWLECDEAEWKLDYFTQICDTDRAKSNIYLTWWGFGLTESWDVALYAQFFSRFSEFIRYCADHVPSEQMKKKLKKLLSIIDDCKSVMP